MFRFLSSQKGEKYYAQLIMNVPNATQAHNRLIECIQKDHDVATVESKSTPVFRQRQSASLQRKSQALNIINFATRTAVPQYLLLVQ